MCGVAGWLGEAPSAGDPGRLLEAAGRLLEHRGPDDGRAASGPGYGFAFRRLAILDLTATGRQPMVTDDGRHVLVMNGEIYNFVELRDELRRAGCTFRGRSDTEVLLQLLAREGVAALDRCNGMFAFAYADLKAERFVLGRDRLGVKPLYYRTPSDRELHFASELKALLALPGAPRTVDACALASYLALGQVPGDQCALAGYRKLAPGHVLQGDLRRPGAAAPARYWSLEVGGDEPVDLEELEALLLDAVRIRLRSDVPVGVFLSGGLDSGLVAALAARAASQAGHAPPVAMTVGFASDEHDESVLAAATARAAGLEHRVVLQQGGALAEVDRLAWYFDEPFGDASALPTGALCEAASRHATVWLSGDGGDEAFGGYRRYTEADRYRLLGLLPPLAGSAVRAVSAGWPQTSRWRYRAVKATAPYGGYAAGFDTTPDDPVVRLVAGDVLRDRLGEVSARWWADWSRTRGRTLVARQQTLDYSSYLPDDILVKVDRASMAHSIEVRSPFLDVRVVEWAARRRRGDLVRAGAGKLPLRRIGGQLLPASVLSARKHGFEAPIAPWLRTPYGARFARERLLGPRAEQLGLWRPAAVERLLTAHAAERGRRLESVLWRLLVLDAWCRRFGDPGEALEPPARSHPAQPGSA